MKKFKNLLKTATVALSFGFVALALTACTEPVDPNAITISSYEEFKEFLTEYSQNDYLDLDIATI